jgi:hypothetical protein
LTVAPHAGAWIETNIQAKRGPAGKVAPHAGAWIETIHPSGRLAWAIVAPHGARQSRQTKQTKQTAIKEKVLSPLRVRDLKSILVQHP